MLFVVLVVYVTSVYLNQRTNTTYCALLFVQGSSCKGGAKSWVVVAPPTHSQTSSHSCPNHSDGLYIQPITNLIPQFSHTLRQPVFNLQFKNSPHRRPTKFVSLYSQPNHKPHTTVVPLNRNSLYSNPNNKTQPTDVAITASVWIYNQIKKRTPRLSHKLLPSVFTTHSQTTPDIFPPSSFSQYK
jgi:hypothetical protein